MCSIGERIKEQRKRLGLTQPQIKELTGISSGTMSDIENGKTLPATPSLIKLSRTLGCTIDWMLTGESPTDEILVFSDNRESELLNGFRELSEEDQEELMEILALKLRRLKNQTGKDIKSSHLESDNMVG